MSSLEFFELYNRPERLQHLVKLGAFLDDWLLAAAEHQEAQLSPFVVAFLQIPQVVSVTDPIYELPAKTEGIRIGFQFRPFLLSIDNQGRLSVSPPINDQANSTQVIAFVPIWGRRRTEAHGRYERCFSPSGMKDDVVLAQDRNPGGRALRATDFEYELSARIDQEIRFALRRFLKSYATLSKLMHAETDLLYNHFLMPFPGRLTYRDPPIPLAAYLVQNNTVALPAEVEGQKVVRGIDFTYRKFSRFERQLFELNRLCQEGHHAIALVGSISLVEWLLRLSLPPTEKKMKFFDMINNLAKRGLAPEVQVALHDLRQLRNKVAHLGEDAKASGKHPHEILELTIDREITPDIARRAIDVAWLIFRKSNSGTLLST